MKKHMRRDAAKATVAHEMDALAPGVAEQVAGKAKATIGQGQVRLGERTGRPELARAGHTLAVEGKVEEFVGHVKAATADAAEHVKATTTDAVEHVKTATADAAEHVKAASERISETLKGQPK